MTPQAVGVSGAARVLGVSARTLYDLARRPEFPRPFVLPAEKRGTRRWWVDELIRWADSRRPA